MKKLLTILILLLTVASQGRATTKVETTLWESTYTGEIELNSEKVATFKAGDVLRVYVTVPEGGTSFKIVYKGASNDWAETTIPSLDTQWPSVNGDEAYKDIAFTPADITAFSGMNIYLYNNKDNNGNLISNITKVSIIKSMSIDFTNLNVGDKIKVTFSKSTEEGASPSLTIKLSDDNVVFSGNPSENESYEFEVTSNNIETIVSNGLILQEKDLTVSTLKVTKPIDCFTGYTDASTHSMTVSPWSGLTSTLDVSGTSAAALNIKTSTTSKIKVLVQFTDGWNYDYTDTEATDNTRSIILDATKTISNIYIQNAGTSNDPITFSDISFAESGTITPNMSIPLTLSDNKVEGLSYTGCNSLYVAQNGTKPISMIVTYADGVVAYKASNAGTRNLKLDDSKTINAIEVINPESGTFSNIYLFNSTDDREDALSSPESGASTVLFSRSDTYSMSEGNQISFKNSQYGSLLSVGQELYFSLSSTGDSRTLTLYDASDSPVETWNLSDLKASMIRLYINSTIHEKLANGFSFKGTGITEVWGVELAMPATQTAPTAGNSLELYNKSEASTVNWWEACYVNSAYGAILAADDEIKITVTKGESDGSVGLIEVNTHTAIGDEVSITTEGEQVVTFSLTDALIEQMRSGFSVWGKDGVKVTKVELYKPEVVADPNLLWSGSQAISWEETKLTGDGFNSLTAGTVLRISLTNTNTEYTSLQIRVKDSEGANETQVTEYSATKTVYEFYITEGLLSKVKNGLYIKGDNTISLTKIEKVTDALVSFTPSEGETVIDYTQAVMQNGWAKSLHVGAKNFQSAKAGDILTVYLANVENGQISLKETNTENDAGLTTELGSGVSLENGATAYTYTLTEENVTNLKAENKELLVSGQGYTVTGVTLKASTSTTRTFTTSVTPTGSGTVTVKLGNEDGTVTTDTEFPQSTQLTAIAEAKTGYQFVKWQLPNGDTAAETAARTVTLEDNIEFIAVFEAEASKLTELESRTLYENLTTTDYLSWNEILSLGSNWGAVLEKGEEIQVTVSAKNSATEWPKVVLRDASSKGVGNDIIVKDITEFPYVATFTLTADNVTALTSGFKIAGDGVTITKIVLHKPAAVTPVFNSEGKADLSKMGVTNSMYVTYDPSTKTISSTKEWEGGVLTMEADENVKNEQLVVTLAEKGNAYIVVNYKEDGVTATEKGIDNGTTTTLNLSDNYIKEIIIKATSGASAETPQTIKLASVVLQAKPVDNRTEHVLTSSAGTIGDWSGGPTFEAYQFANAEVGDRIVVTISELPDGDYHQIALQSNGSADKLGGTQNAVVGDYEVTLDADGLAELKANGLYVTGKYYTYSKIALWSENELGEEPKEDEISNTSATEAAKKVYNVLKNLYGKKIVSGVVANVDWNTKEAENVYNWTGKYPAMNVYDFINLHASKDVNSAGWVDYSDITTAKNWWKEGGIVGAMWHWQVKANNGTDYTCTPGTAANETSFDASKVYVDGTDQNTLAKQQLDQLCGYLKKMQDAGIPVVWRPLHEASGNVEQYSGGKAWFWWGAKGADVYKQLWQWMYNYMVNTKGLNNLIWVWTSQTNDNNWYPGDAYVDIIGRDNYGATAATLATEYEALKAAYPNKMITLSECGNSESTEMAKLSSIWDAGSRWSWFMTWYDGAYNDGTSTTHKHAGETWWKDAVSKDYVVTRDQMKELLGQESSDDSKTGVNISLDDLNEGWSSSYNATTKTITTEGEWAARGWYIGDNRYNSKGSVTVKYEAVQFGVTLKMEYTNTNGDSKSVSAGAAAGETEVELDIPTDVKTIEKVYITYQPIGTLKLTAATVNDKVVDNRTERTLVEKSQAISDGDIAINRGLFSNAVAGDEIRIYADGLSESSKLALEPGDYSGAFDGANWTGFTESPFKLKLTATLIATIKEKGLLIRGESFTFKKAVLYTEKELGSEISDEEKKGDEEKDDEETIIDEKTGEADLTQLAAQDDTKTTLTENEDGSITMTTTEPYCAAQIWFNDPEPVAGNVLKVELAESNVNVTVTVKYTDGTESQMSANTMVANARAMTRAVASARAATRGDSDPGTTIEVPLETGKEVQNIEVKNNVAGTITIKKMQMTTINIFTNGVANLSMLKPQSNATYDTSTHTLATTKGWTGATISPVDGENVSGKELLIEFADASKVKVAVKYRTDVEGPSTIMEKAAKAVRLALDNTKNIQEISIQPTEASIVTFKKIAVNSEESDDGTLKPGKTITLWENAAGETLSWNEVANQDASVGDMLQEYDELLITISGVTEGCDWPKVFIRDASSEQAGNEVLLNDVGSFPYTVRIVLTGEMAQQLQKGFSICGDGVTVTKLQVYRPEAPKTGDIHLADLNYGYNSSYDKGTHTITTTARWAARGWEIGDKRYNDKNLITVKFEPVDFPVTLKMEYTTGLQTAQATSVGVPAGRTELLLEIPKGISKLNRVYIIYENPGKVKLTEASVTYMENLKLSTAIQAFEADGVIRDGRYDTDGWYNLRGMRIPEPTTSGIYIHGGKKVVIY